MPALKKRRKKKVKTPCHEFANVKGARRERLIFERKKRKLKQSELGKLVGFSTAYISALENGRIKPSFEVALALEEEFHLPFEILFPDL
ncbi:helix-turn-helix transcriptional regulator [Bacillus sp. FJAT-45350]|uniref:helix-turn-helix transcriptional regulator n=1 Tax=Bacillus sp. FJAT-45350 TaxID=2011014 RepID=UPI000BB96CD4|nr:helix-turn-helix transcriptional regulator [Bacillus sp. FJAT-45350]